MKALGITVLILVALFTGGCSLVFLFSFPNVLVLVGFGIAGLCIWRVTALVRKPADKGEAVPDE